MARHLRERRKHSGTTTTGSDGCLLSRSTAGEYAPMPRLRLLARLLCWFYSWSWEGTLAPTSSSSVPKAQLLQAPATLLALADLVYLLPLGSWMRLKTVVLHWDWLPCWVMKCLGS